MFKFSGMVSDEQYGVFIAHLQGLPFYNEMKFDSSHIPQSEVERLNVGSHGSALSPPLAVASESPTLPVLDRTSPPQAVFEPPINTEQPTTRLAKPRRLYANPKKTRKYMHPDGLKAWEFLHKEFSGSGTERLVTFEQIKRALVIQGYEATGARSAMQRGVDEGLFRRVGDDWAVVIKRTANQESFVNPSSVQADPSSVQAAGPREQKLI